MLSRAVVEARAHRRDRRARRARAGVAACALALCLPLAACGSNGTGGSSASAKDDVGATEPGTTAGQAVDPPSLDPDLAVASPPPLTGRLQSADLLVQAPGALSEDTIAAVQKLPGVTKVLSVSMAQVQVEGQTLNVLAVDPSSYRAYTERSSAYLQEVWDRVARGEVAVPATADKKLIDAGGYLKLGTGDAAPVAHVGAYAPQVPFIDAVVNDKWGAELKMTPGNALIISTGINAPSKVQKPLQELVGEGISVQGLDAIAQYGIDIGATQTAFLVGSVAEAVGTYRYTVLSGGRVQPDASWVSSHVETQVVPILGSVTCNTYLFPQLKAALGEIVENNLADTIHPGEYAGCYYPRFIAGSSRLSNHAFGLALDLNVPGNQRGTVGQMDPGVVAIFKKWGFAWGGDWGYTDPMHFEMAALVKPG